jgi:hypothetical protein
MRSAFALHVDALNLEKFTSPNFKNEFHVAAIVCVNVLKHTVYFPQLWLDRESNCTLQIFY